jgi:NADH-quinone oxidoreductase subunit G
MLNIEIDGKPAQVETGATIMDAAAEVGVYIPHFCYHKKLSIAANCRMCLVQVEKAAKPMPACATPVTDGMKVMTRSDYAIKAQKGVMEFLLINHPLDCPICDQGGECQLQDLAVGYGASKSRYDEPKRVVMEKNLGTLVATDMTRCIHCTRCVRFGQEVAGIMEMGQIGRGEHSEIMPFIDRTIDSELSGNIIDLCPVGALTSKPFRYTARTWELSRRRAVSPHDGLGANLQVHVKNNRVMRVVPHENDAINECWLSDRDRFAYEGLNSPDRLQKPLIKKNGQWVEVDWQSALEHVAYVLTEIRRAHGAEQTAALASPQQTVEELYLLQKLMRAAGSPHVDHRLRQSDFSLDGSQARAHWLGMPVADLEKLDRVLVIGGTLRHEHPLLAHRLRKAVRFGAQLSLVDSINEDWLVPVSHRLLLAPDSLVAGLGGVLNALAALRKQTLPAEMAAFVPDATATAIATSLASGKQVAVLLGNLAQHHPQAAQLHWLAQEIARLSGATLGVLAEAGNSVGAVLAGAVPYAGPCGAAVKQAGLAAGSLLSGARKAYLLLGVEPELDSHDPVATLAALKEAEFVVAMTAYRPENADWADVLLPIAPYTETGGSFVNMAGQMQSFHGTVKPQGEARPAWKVLRVLGNLLKLDGFAQDSVEDVRQEWLASAAGAGIAAFLGNDIPRVALTTPGSDALQRVGNVPIYQGDAVVRRATSLQKSRLAAPPVARMSGALIDRLALAEGALAKFRQANGSATLRIERDDSLPETCVQVPAAHPQTAGLGPMFGAIRVERI